MIETLPAFLSFVVGVVVLLTDVEESCVFASIGTRCRIDGETLGVCMIKENCAAYMDLYTSLLTIENVNFLRELQCENLLYPDETIVCCPYNSTEYQNPSLHIDFDKLTKIAESEADAVLSDTNSQHLLDYDEYSILNMMNITSFIDRLDQEVDDDPYQLLPQKFECGDGAQFVNRVFGGDFTSISEFPWMALLIYNTNASRPYGCGGSLINQRYVLTAAHCVTGKMFESKCGLRSIRLGEYNIETEEDCMPSKTPAGHILKCADPVVEVGVEKIIVHPGYNDKSRDKHHDIALLRLDTNVTYSKYIKPICLPVAGLSAGLITGNKLTVAGWGSTNVFKRYGEVSSSIKLKVRLPIANMTDCLKAYNAYNLNLGSGQVCAGGMKGKDSCLGDSGGPLMFFDRKNSAWVASGIVSFGAEKCGTIGLPGVYTKIENYLDWIINNLEK